MSNRRTFLQQSGMAALAAMVSPSLISSALAGTMERAKISKVGIQLYTLRDLLQKDVSSVIPKLAQLGYKQVETFYGYDAKNAAKGFWGLDAKEFKTLLDTNGITSPSGHYNESVFLTEGGGTDVLKNHIEVAATVGQKYLTIPSIPGDHHKAASADFYKKIAAKFNEAGQLAKAQGLKLAYHNHNFEFGDLGGGVTPYEIFLTETDPSLVSFELDLFWAVNAGLNPIDMFKKHPGRFKMWHVKDMDKADKSVFTEVGTGSINFKEIFSNAKTSGLEYIFVEQDVIKIEPYKSVGQSIDYIKKSLL